MKRLILAIQILLLAAIQMMADDYKVIVGSEKVPATVVQSGTTYTIGNGFNASIPPYKVGTLTIPRITNTAGDQNVVGRFAFRFCSEVTKIVVEEGITTIDDFAFIGCGSVETIELPASLTKVGRGAFVGMPKLQSIVCKATTVPAWSRADVFSYEGTASSMAADAKTRILYVPAGCYEQYRSYKYNGQVGWADAFIRIYEVSTEPKKIASLDELKAFRDAVNDGTYLAKYGTKTFELTDDITFRDKHVTSEDMNVLTSENWKPIGTEEHPFEGTFNGGGYTIRNMAAKSVNASGNLTAYAGLFGYVTNATIYNLCLDGPTVSGTDYVGTVVGYAKEDCHLSDILVTGNSSADNDYTVTATSGCVGGLIGGAYKATIERSMFQGNVSGKGVTGGIIGSITNDVTVTDCSASNRLLCSGEYVGGIVGRTVTGTLKRCMAANEFRGASTTSNPQARGWLAGYLENNNKSVTDCVYWKNSGEHAAQYEVAAQRWGYDGNVGKTSLNDMKREGVITTLGTDNWYYFTDNYSDLPVPITLADMYIDNCVNKTDNNDIVYHLSGDEGVNYEVIGYTGTASTLAIPETFNGMNVVGIAAEAFKDNKTLTSVTLGANLKTIGYRAFANCEALTAIDLPDAVTTVQWGAFSGCSNLTSFNIGKGFNEAPGNFLADCPKLTTLTASRGNDNSYQCVDNVLIRDLHSYNGYSYLVLCAPGKTGDYTLPLGSLKGSHVWVMKNCFANCTGLTSITFPAGKNYKLGVGLFNGASNLKEVDMSNANNIENFGTVDRMDANNPFYGLSNLTSVYLPSGKSAQDYEPNVFIMNGDKTAATANYVLLDDGSDFMPKVPVTATNGVDYKRYVDYFIEREDASYAPQGLTVCLPYDLTLKADHVKVFTLSKIKVVGATATAIFTEVADKQMKAYTPYYVKVSDEQEIDFGTEGSTEIAVKPTAEPAAIDGYEFKGTTVTVPNTTLYNAQKPAFLLRDDGKWQVVTKNDPDAYAAPFCAYLQATGSSSVSTINTVAWDGDGSEAKPYIISSAEQLNEMQEALNGSGGASLEGKYFRQGANIKFDKTQGQLRRRRLHHQRAEHQHPRRQCRPVRRRG